MPDDNQLFTNHEIKALADVQEKLIIAAQSGNVQSLLDFWQAKRSVEVDRLNALAIKAMNSFNAKPVKKKWYQRLINFFKSHMKRV